MAKKQNSEVKAALEALPEIEARLEAITPGLWVKGSTHHGGHNIYTEDEIKTATDIKAEVAALDKAIEERDLAQEIVDSMEIGGGTDYDSVAAAIEDRDRAQEEVDRICAEAANQIKTEGGEVTTHDAFKTAEDAEFAAQAPEDMRLLCAALRSLGG